MQSKVGKRYSVTFTESVENSSNLQAEFHLLTRDLFEKYLES